MSTHHKHRVERHRWINGVLHTSTHLFESMFDAISWAESLESEAHSIKIYNDAGDLVHSSVSNQETYA